MQLQSAMIFVKDLPCMAEFYGEVLGLGVSSDAHHIAIPDPTGSGAVRAMTWAMEDAGIRPDQVDYINAHGSATETNDPLETKAIKEVFGERSYDIPVTSTKSMTGHAQTKFSCQVPSASAKPSRVRRRHTDCRADQYAICRSPGALNG